MALASGARIGVYEVTALIGEGGMGQVYQAADTTLGRQVAIKILPDEFAVDADRIARFEREAKTLASLNHPHIAAIYGFEKSAGAYALVMELVEGEDLSQRIARGAIPLDEALPIAKQIADALAAAHDKGIIHRDLKPANVKVRTDGTVKVLDFGLAKAFEGEPGMGGTSIAPTLTSPAVTRIGTILGTAAYMSPEQARGRTVDRRTDIWAFGVLLYEMVTGRRPFQGEDVTETVAAVVKEQPDLNELPPSLRKLMKACLEKDPKRRLQAIGDAWFLLEDAETLKAPSGSLRRFRFAWLAAAAGLLVAAAVSLMHFGERPIVPESVRFRISAPEGVSMLGGQAPRLSPDGRRLVFVGVGSDSRRRLWLHSLDSLESQPLGGTEGAASPFWSSDSRVIGFFVDGRVLKVAAAGGPVQTVAESSAQTDIGRADGAWSTGGVIVFAGLDGLRRVSEDGGASDPLTVLDRSRGELLHTSPVFLPDGIHFLYVRGSSVAENSGIYVGSLDAQPVQKGFSRLGAAEGRVAYVPSSNAASGHVLFVRDGSLMAQPFDHRGLELTGPPVPITEQAGEVGSTFFSASANGVLAFRPNRAGGDAELSWFNRDGKLLGTALKPGLLDVALSPDGSRVAGTSSESLIAAALSRGSGRGRRIPSRSGANGDLWLGEFDRGTRTRFTANAAEDRLPVWSPDGTRIIFASDRDGAFNLYQRASSGGSNEEPLLKSGDNKLPTDWSHDGRFLLYANYESKGGENLWVLPLSHDGTSPGQSFSYLTTDFNEGDGRFSPDGRWIAYRSNETGQDEIYIQAFPTPSGVTVISSGGGREPRWRRDGSELFYLGPRGQVMVVELATSPAIRVTRAARRLFDAPIYGGPGRTNSFDVAADGQRFLVTTSPGARLDPGSITVVMNWQSALTR